MIISLRKCIRYVQMTVYILLFSFVIYEILSIFQSLIQPIDPYREPQKDAVKVASSPHQQDSWWQPWVNRLKEFYFTGE